jgi:ATP-binding cassette subfamily F protein uup
MPIVTTRNLRLGFGGAPLLDGVDLQIEAGERACLVGHNGAGKSTLLKVLAGTIAAEDGELEIRQGLKIASLDQQLPESYIGCVFDCIAEGLGATGELVRRYHRLSGRLGDRPDDRQLNELHAVQHELEARGGWTVQQQVDSVISRLGLDADARFEHLSGGMQRRVLLGRALVGAPDLLLLDEPTNHLDIESIIWLEDFLDGFTGTLLFITHDRRFLERLATRIIDLDRGRITSWPGDYRNYLHRKQEQLDAEASQQAAFDRKLASEEQWIRQGIKARRTRNEGRVRALQKMREQRAVRRARTGKATMRAQQDERSGKLVIETDNAGYTLNGQHLIQALTTTILRGDKVGIIGPNGVGKTTLLRLLLGELEPDSGSIRRGTKLQPAYFDQRRAQLDSHASVIDNLADGRQFIDIDGQQQHVISYLQDFLFAPQRCHSPVRALSGGERNRLLLAKLFSKPSNLLVLDEPTNDLDIDTLELLEEQLVEYAGTVLLVSHDRSFLDNVVTSTLVFEGNGRVNEYVGGYRDWQGQRQPAVGQGVTDRETVARPTPHPPRRSDKLGYRDQRELEQLPHRIEKLEQDLETLHRRMSEPGFYRLSGEEIAATREELAATETELHSAYQRWEQLEQQKPA